MKVIYLAGPYSGDVGVHIARARAHAQYYWRRGLAVITPHLNTANFEIDAPDIAYETFLQGDFALIEKADAVVLLPNWRESPGAVRERALALSLGKPVCEAPALPVFPLPLVVPVIGASGPVPGVNLGS